MDTEEKAPRGWRLGWECPGFNLNKAGSPRGWRRNGDAASTGRKCRPRTPGLLAARMGEDMISVVLSIKFGALCYIRTLISQFQPESPLYSCLHPVQTSVFFRFGENQVCISGFLVLQMLDKFLESPHVTFLNTLASTSGLEIHELFQKVPLP